MHEKTCGRCDRTSPQSDYCPRCEKQIKREIIERALAFYYNHIHRGVCPQCDVELKDSGGCPSCRCLRTPTFEGKIEFEVVDPTPRNGPEDSPEKEEESPSISQSDGKEVKIESNVLEEEWGDVLDELGESKSSTVGEGQEILCDSLSTRDWCEMHDCECLGWKHCPGRQDDEEQKEESNEPNKEE